MQAHLITSLKTIRNHWFKRIFIIIYKLDFHSSRYTSPARSGYGTMQQSQTTQYRTQNHQHYTHHQNHYNTSQNRYRSQSRGRQGYNRNQSQPANPRFHRPIRDKSEELRAREIRCLSLTRSKSSNRQFERRLNHVDRKDLSDSEIKEVGDNHYEPK